MEVLTGFVRWHKATTPYAGSLYSRETRRIFNLARQFELKPTARFGHADATDRLAPGYYVGWFARFDRPTQTVVPYHDMPAADAVDAGYCRVLVRVFGTGRCMTLAMRNAGIYVPADGFSMVLALTRVASLAIRRADVLTLEAEAVVGSFVRRFAQFSLQARALTTMQPARVEMVFPEKCVQSLSPYVADARAPVCRRV